MLTFPAKTLSTSLITAQSEAIPENKLRSSAQVWTGLGGQLEEQQPRQPQTPAIGSGPRLQALRRSAFSWTNGVSNG